MVSTIFGCQDMVRPGKIPVRRASVASGVWGFAKLCCEPAGSQAATSSSTKGLRVGWGREYTTGRGALAKCRTVLSRGRSSTRRCCGLSSGTRLCRSWRTWWFDLETSHPSCSTCWAGICNAHTRWRTWRWRPRQMSLTPPSLHRLRTCWRRLPRCLHCWGSWFVQHPCCPAQNWESWKSCPSWSTGSPFESLQTLCWRILSMTCDAVLMMRTWCKNGSLQMTWKHLGAWVGLFWSPGDVTICFARSWSPDNGTGCCWRRLKR